MKKCPDLTFQATLYRDALKEFHHRVNYADFKKLSTLPKDSLHYLGFLISNKLLLQWICFKIIADYQKRLWYTAFEENLKNQKENGVPKEGRYLYFICRTRATMYSVSNDELTTHLSRYFQKFVNEVHWGKPTQEFPDALLRVHDDQPYHHNEEKDEVGVAA